MPYRYLTNQKKEPTNFKGTFQCIFCTIKKKKSNFNVLFFYFCLDPDMKIIIPDPEKSPRSNRIRIHDTV